MHQRSEEVDTSEQRLHDDRWRSQFRSVSRSMEDPSDDLPVLFRIPQPQDNLLSLTSMFAVSSGSLGIHLQDIPNQPFRFWVRSLFSPRSSNFDFSFQADPSNRSRSEDALIAWTWKVFIENPTNPEILLRMPMTKVCPTISFHFIISFDVSRRRYERWTPFNNSLINWALLCRRHFSSLALRK